MNKSWIILLSISIVTIFTSCEKESPVPDQSRVYTEYSISYNETLDKTTAQTTFLYDGGSEMSLQKMELMHPAMVSYNGKDLIFDKQERIYQKEFIGLIEDQFLYKNYYGIPYPNPVGASDSLKIVLPTDSTSLYSDFYVSWDGNELKEGESIIVSICNLQSGREVKIENSQVGTEYINIWTSDLVYLGAGNAVIKLSRTIEADPTYAPQAGGNILMNYESEDTVYFY